MKLRAIDHIWPGVHNIYMTLLKDDLRRRFVQRAAMLSDFLQTFRRAFCSIRNRAPPIDLESSDSVPPLLDRTIQDVAEIARRGPALTLSDLVCCVDALL